MKIVGILLVVAVAAQQMTFMLNDREGITQIKDQFHLTTAHTSYVFRITKDQQIEQLFWGNRVDTSADLAYIVGDVEDYRNERQFEYGSYGNGDFRIPSFRATFTDDGSTVVVWKYQSFEINSNATHFEDWMPHFRAKHSQSLTLTFKDELKGLVLKLTYYVFYGHDIIARHVDVTNEGVADVILEEVNSFSVDLPPPSYDKPYYLNQFSGSWGNERKLVARKLDLGLTGFESRRGASSMQHNPFFVVSEGPMQENFGAHYCFGLVYTASYKVMLEIQQNLMLRITGGIHPEQFSWRLAQGESFQSPQSFMGYSGKGMGSLSRDLHKLIRDAILPGEGLTQWTPTAPRPVLVNSWEAMYFDCSEEKILKNLADPAVEMGIDMVVLDDGWQRNRRDDKRALGDWIVDKTKFPDGLGGLSEKIRAKGLTFGIWMEPEMISVESLLYKEHPDWCLHVKGRERSEFRNQLVLDLSRQEVQDFMVESVTNVLRESKAQYLKWDFNRHLTEVGNEIADAKHQGQILHKWTLGLYKVWHRVTKAFPEVLFESCSSGGGRFDLGLLYFTPQVWTSDNTDALTRTQIQWGTSFAYPYNTMASHISTVPNHQLQRVTPFFSRHLVAMSGVLGYELDLLKLSDKEKLAIPQYLKFYRENVQKVVLNGDMYRLKSPFPLDRVIQVPQNSAWMFVDRESAVVFVVLASQHEVFVRPHHLKLEGLIGSATYSVERIQGNNDSGMNRQPLGKFQGSTLMNVGLITHLWGDVDSMMFHLVLQR